jgi:hypothetical protein
MQEVLHGSTLPPVRRADRRSLLIFGAKLAGAVALVLFIVIERPFLPSRTPSSSSNLRAYVSGFDSPTYIAAAPGQPDRLYVVEQAGTIRYVRAGRIAGTLLDIRSRVSCGGERGLLSVAFSPSYARNHLFYVDYTDRRGDTRVVEFRSRNNSAILGSARQLLFVDQPYPNHNGGQLQFGPDGLLYVGMGDGGSGGDPQNHAQNVADRLGKLLRIDPTKPSAEWQVVGYGLRNPWRFSFDRATGDLWIGDVGQDAWEEIDFQTRTSKGGENYGWKIMEGNHCGAGGAANCPTNPAPPPCGSPLFQNPLFEYDHAGGRCSVTGGYVYRGSQDSGLVGTYLYGDYCSGQIWGNGQLLSPIVPGLTTFGQDASGELYAATDRGRLLRIAHPNAPTPTPTPVPDSPRSSIAPIPGQRPSPRALPPR